MAEAKAKPKNPEPSAEATYTAAAIIDLVTTKRGTTSFEELLQQMETDFDLFTLKPYVAEKDHQSYTSPAPKNDFNKVLAGLNKATLTWQIVTAEDAPQSERDAANDGEKLLTGVLDRVDRQLRKIGEPPLRQGIGWYAGARGMSGLKCLIYANDQKETVFDIKPIDPMHMAWEQGAEGLVWWAYLYHISKAEALERWGITLTTKEQDAIIIDFFTQKINAIVLYMGGASSLTGQFVKEVAPHGLDHVPAWVGFASSMPTVYTRDSLPTLKYRAASVYASSRGIYEPHNKQVSFIMDTAEKSVAGTLIYETEEGKKGIEGDPYANWQVIRTKKGEVLKPLDPPKVPPESAVILSVIDRDKQQSTVPYPTGYGIDQQAHSGAALSMMNDGTKSVYSPFTGLIEDAFQWLCEEIISQFKAKGQTLKLQGFDPAGKFFAFEAKPQTIKDDWYIKVTCEPKLPRDEAGELQMALAATQPRANGKPFMSDYTAREKIVKMQNPDAEETRIQSQLVNDMIDKLPAMQVRQVAKALIDKGDIQGAKEFLATIPPPGGGPPPTGGAPAGMPAGAAPQAGAIPPQVAAIIQNVAARLGMRPEQVAQMPPEQVQSMLAQKEAEQQAGAGAPMIQ